MSLLFPKRPVGNSPSTIYHQRIWDVCKALESRFAPGVATDVTTRGVFQRAVPSQAAGTGETDIPEWDDTGYEEGDYVRRTMGVSSEGGGEIPGADAEGVDAAQVGRRLGIWRALEDIPDGQDNPPSLDSDKWEFISGLGVEAFTLEKAAVDSVNGGTIYFSVRADPLIQILSTDGATKILLDLTLCTGKILQPREVDVCVNGVRKRMLVIASEPYAI